MMGPESLSGSALVSRSPPVLFNGVGHRQRRTILDRIEAGYTCIRLHVTPSLRKPLRPHEEEASALFSSNESIVRMHKWLQV